MSRRLHTPKMWIECEVRDKDGKLIDKRKFRGMSWVGNIIALLSSIFGVWGVTTSSIYGVAGRSDIVKTDGTTTDFAIAGGASSVCGGQAPAGDLRAGILVGASDTPVSIGQYDLLQRITHGTGAGQLLYGSTVVETLIKTATTWTLRIVRTFTNGSGATVTVKEIGLFHCRGSYTFMLARDVISPAIEVPDGATLTVRYIITHTV